MIKSNYTKRIVFSFFMPSRIRLLAIVLYSIILLFFSSKCPAQVNKHDCIAPFDLEKVYNEYKRASRPLANIEFDKPLNPLWVQRDLLILKDILEEANTSLYRYTTKDRLNNLFDQKLCQLQDSVSYLEFVRVIAQVFNTVACGHSGWSHNVHYRKHRNNKMTFFPLKVFSYKDQYFIHQNGSMDSTIVPGDRIIGINGQTPDQLNTILRKHMGRDGQSAPWGTADIDQYFQMAYSNFIANPDTFKLIIEDQVNKQRRSVNLPAQKRHITDSILKSKYAKVAGLGRPLRFNLSSDKKVATYTIKWFRNEYIKSQGQNFINFTDSVFHILCKEKVENLIIDLRGNRGGWTANGMELFSYFITRPTRYIDKVEFNKTDSFSFSNLLLRDQEIEDSMLFTKNERGLLEWSNYHVQVAQPKKQHVFSRPIYILIDDMSRSCSAVFSALMKTHTNAVFIGEESGGAQCGQNGMVLVAQLPYTGLVVKVSTGQYTCNVTDQSNPRGVIPDYTIKRTWNDFVNKRDPQMEYVKTLIYK